MQVNCLICGSIVNHAFSALILNKYEVEYYRCPNCSFMFTENPYWLNESYKEPINKSDTGILQRNIDLANKTRRILFYLFDYKKTFLDFGAGYGFLVRLMRDKGFNFLWADAYAENLVSRGFEFTNETIELITTFETFEHFYNPLNEIEKMLKISTNILFTTLLYPTPIPSPSEWFYYGLSHGQHISFYQLKTLRIIAQKYNLKIYSNGTDFHLFTSKKIRNFKWIIINNDLFSSVLDLYSKNKLLSKTWEDHLKVR